MQNMHILTILESRHLASQRSIVHQNPQQLISRPLLPRHIRQHIRPPCLTALGHRQDSHATCSIYGRSRGRQVYSGRQTRGPLQFQNTSPAIQKGGPRLLQPIRIVALELQEIRCVKSQEFTNRDTHILGSKDPTLLPVDSATNDIHHSWNPAYTQSPCFLINRQIRPQGRCSTGHCLRHRVTESFRCRSGHVPLTGSLSLLLFSPCLVVRLKDHATSVRNQRPQGGSSGRWTPDF